MSKDPLEDFSQLYTKQKQSEQSKYPKWLSPHIYYYHVLLHDVFDGAVDVASAVILVVSSMSFPCPSLPPHPPHYLLLSAITKSRRTSSQPMHDSTIEEQWSVSYNLVKGFLSQISLYIIGDVCSDCLPYVVHKKGCHILSRRGHICLQSLLQVSIQCTLVSTKYQYIRFCSFS